MSQSIEREPAFNWWVTFVLKNRAHIIYLVQKRSTRYLKHNQKYGINLPKTVEEALILDKLNGNTLCSDATAKEMTNFKVAFKIIDNYESVLRNHQFVKCHMIFDLKMDKFRQKARIVAGGHIKKSPAAVTYSSVVSCETVHIDLTIAALNDLQVKCSNLLNTYITAQVMECIWTTLVPKFGNDQGKTEMFVRGFCDLKSSSAVLRKHLGEYMSGLGYKLCLADTNLWLKLEVRDDGVK